MPMEIRYHLDENMNPAIAHGLMLRGVDATVTRDVGLAGASDEEQIAFALREQRVLVTHDDDLLSMAGTGVPHAGIGFCPSRNRTIGRIVRGLLRLWRTRTAEEMPGQIEFI